MNANIDYSDDYSRRSYPSQAVNRRRSGATPRRNEHDERVSVGYRLQAEYDCREKQALINLSIYLIQTSIAILKVYSNDLLMETIISNITRLSVSLQSESLDYRNILKYYVIQ